MKSILDHIKSLENKQWDYYSEVGKRKLLNPFTQNVDFTEFIRRYFESAGKLNIIQENGMQVDNLYRPSHTCSIFFLGVLLYYKTDLHKYALDGTNKVGYESFPFIWFLTTLYHDFGAAYEKHAKQHREILNLNQLKERFNIQHWLLDKKIKDTSPSLFNLCTHYYEYRIKEMNSIDHGILGGIVLFDRLVKNRNIRHRKTDNKLYWGSELDEQYAQAAAAVAAHNIWLPQNQQVKTIYADYGLNYLVRFPPLTLQNFPLLYILGIVDTIDPVKTFTDNDQPHNEKYILNNLLISFKPLEIYIRNAPNSALNFSLLTKKANLLKGWIAVDIKTTKNTMRISFKEHNRNFSALSRRQLR